MAAASSAPVSPATTPQLLESRRDRRAREVAESSVSESASAPASGEAELKILPSSRQPRIRPRVASQPPKLLVTRAPVFSPEPNITSAPEQPALEPPAPEQLAPVQAITDRLRYRFDVGTIPLAPHSAKLPLAAPLPPGGGESIASITDAASISLGRILRRSLSVTLAAASVAGLLLTAAIPALAPMSDGDGSQAAAIQQLILGRSSASSLDADVVEGVDGAEVAADSALISADTFVNNPFGIVQYPFSQGVPLTDPFGYRTAPIAQFHDGQDFAAGNGAAIRSIADGTVLESGPTTDGCGTGMKISHKVDGLDVTSRYCHMQEGSTRFEVGGTVKAGQMIGRVGSTGMAFGEHLHLVISIAGEPVDPMPFFAKYNAVSR